ncbi:MAG: DUF4157 domain-containing protein [Silvibacterium sp.]
MSRAALSAPSGSSHPPALRRKCACGGTCDKCKDERNKTLQRKSAQTVTDTITSVEAPPIVHQVLRSPGQPLDDETRSFMESRFGYDFSQVRVHTDAGAQKSADAVDALAYTVGRHISFAEGSFAPHSASGRHLLAHELTHVAQQNGATPMIQRAPPKDKRGTGYSHDDTDDDLSAYEEKYGDDPKYERRKDQRISDAHKSELEDSGWLKKRVTDPDDRRAFMKWLEKRHGVGEAHNHFPPGARRTVRALKQWKEEEAPHLLTPEERKQGIDTTSLDPAPGEGKLNAPPKSLATPSIEDALAEEGIGAPKAVKGAEGGLGPKAAEGAGSSGLSLRGAALEAGGNIALGVAALVGVAIWTLMIQPRIDSELKKLNDLVAPIREERRKKVLAQVAQKFDTFQAIHVGRILQSCWIEKLRAMEKARKQAYIRVSLNVQFADTRWLLKQGSPSSLFDIELVGVDLVGVTVRESAEPPVTSQLAESEQKNFVTGENLWEQQLSFSIKAPTADQVEKQFGKEPAARNCVNDAGACFIATACYGSPHGEELDALRAFRDAVLSRSRAGRYLTRLYYRRSTPAALWLWSHPMARIHVRKCLITPLARLVRHVIKEFDNQGVGS